MFKRKPSQQEIDDMQNIIKVLGEIYSNKSSDEFKCKGDIRKVPMYKEIDKQIANLSTLKKFPANDAKEIKTMFLSLHRPIFPQMVMAYLNKPDERNSTFTALFTVGYRVLVGELARIYASTEATDKGLVYKPDKRSRREDMSWFIKAFNDDLDKKVDEYLRATYNEYATFHDVDGIYTEGGVDTVIVGAANLVIRGLQVLPKIFRSAKQLNPISFFNAVLMRSYDRKVEKFEEVSAMYEATKQAYEDYLRIPESDRKRKIESNYKKNLEKYNIKMNNLKAQIDHYDSRAMEEANDTKKKTSKSATTKPDNPKPMSTPTSTSDDTGSDTTNSSDGESSGDSGTSSDDDFDF